MKHCHQIVLLMILVSMCVNSQLCQRWLEYTQLYNLPNTLESLSRILANSAIKMLTSVRSEAQPGPVSLHIGYV